MKKLNKTHIKFIQVTCFMQLIFFAIVMFFLEIGTFAKSSEQEEKTYTIVLPQKVDGVNKLEYIIDNENKGSTSGKENIDAKENSLLNFLLQVEPEGYSLLKAKDIKIKSEKGQTLNLMKYMYNKEGELTKIALSENDVIDPKQTYITSDYKVVSNDTLSLESLTKDTFKANITLDSKDYQANESLDVSYTLGKDTQEQKALYNEKNNSFEIQNITVGTPVTLKINAKEDFSQSKPEFFSEENRIISCSDGSLKLPAVKSDINLIVKNIHKNEYYLSFGNYDDISFEYKRQGAEEDFTPAGTEALKVISGESYDVKCIAKSEEILSGKEITANSIALKKVNDVYSISNIKEDIKVDITAIEDTYYAIGLPEKSCGLTITDESGNSINFGKSKYNDNFKFKIKAEEGYQRNIVDALIYAVPTNKLESGEYNTENNPEESEKYLLAPSENGVYCALNIKEPISIIVKNLIKDSYRVKFPDVIFGASYKVETSEGVSEISQNLFSVTHGSKVLVTLTADEGKSLENVTLGCNNSDIIVSKNENTYTIENITDDSSIIINNIEDKKCSVTFDSDGIICEDETGSVFNKNTINLSYKSSIKFKIKLANGHTSDSGITLDIKSGNAELSKLSEENFYEISNITENTEISVSGIQKKQLSVKLDSSDSSAVFVSTETGETLPNLNNVEYGDSLEFKVSSNNNQGQIYTVTSSDNTSKIITLDSSENKFELKNTSSNVTLSAVPVFTSTDNITTANNNISTRSLATPKLSSTQTTEGETKSTEKSVYVDTSLTPDGNRYYYYKPGSSTLGPSQRTYDVSCKVGDSETYKPFGQNNFPSRGIDTYKVEYIRNDDNDCWIGRYKITYKVKGKVDEAYIEDVALYTNALHHEASPSSVRVGRNGYAYDYSTEASYLIESCDVKKSDSGELGEIEISLAITVTINGSPNLDGERITLFRNVDFKPMVPSQYYTGETVKIWTKLTLDDVQYHFYEQNASNRPSTNDYSFFYSLDPYSSNPPYTDISDGYARSNDPQGGNNVTYLKSKDGYWEGTYGIRFKAKSKREATQLIDNIKFYTKTEHNESHLIGQEKIYGQINGGESERQGEKYDNDASDDFAKFEHHIDGVSVVTTPISFKIIQCDSVHSTKDPGAEELLIQIKIVIDTTFNEYLLFGNDHIRLFHHIDPSLKFTDEIKYNVDLFEQIFTFNSSISRNNDYLSGLTFEGPNGDVINKEFIDGNEIPDITTMNMMKNVDGNTKNISNFSLYSKNDSLTPEGSFSICFKITSRMDGGASSDESENISQIISLTPHLIYRSANGAITSEPLVKGSVYNIITASRQDLRWTSSCFPSFVDVYNKIALSIDEYTAGDIISDDNGQTISREFRLSGKCTLLDYSCDTTDIESEKIGNIFKGKENEENDLSYVEYQLGVPSVEADISFESTNSATFMEIKKTEENDEIEEVINDTIHVPENEKFSFVLRANPGYKLEPEYDENNLQAALYCIKIDGESISQNNYFLTVREYTPDRNYIRYDISGISKNNLKISVNPYMIDYIKFLGTFGGINSSYTTFDGASFDQHYFKYGEENFTFYVNPSEEAQGDPINCNIIIDGDIRSYNYPTAQNTSGAEYSVKDSSNVNIFSIRSTYTNRGIEITLAGIKTEFKITFDYERKTVPVTFNTDGRFSYNILSPLSLSEEGVISTTIRKQIQYGRNLSFGISPSNESINLSDITVTANGVPIYMINGKYTIKSITEEQTIEVKNVSTSTNIVTFTKYSHIFFKDLESNTYAEKVPVEYNGGIQFRVSTSDAYSQSEGKLTVKAELASGTVLTFSPQQPDDTTSNETSPNIALYDENSNSYTLKNLRENARLYIQDLKPNEYTITFKNVDGIEYYNEYGTEKLNSYEQKVSHGENFGFKVVAKEGYSLSDLKIYDQANSSENPIQILPANDIYTISNVEDDHTVTANDVAVSKCKVEFRSLAGASFVDSYENVIDGSIEVNYGSNYKFRLSLDKAYDKSIPTVNIKGVSTPLSKDADGTYTILNIRENKIIEITNVVKNSYTATFKAAEGVIYKNSKNKPFEGVQQVEYDSNLYFKISLMDAYDKSIPWVLMNEDKTLVENGGVYSLENIHDDVTVTVRNVVKNPEEVGISDILNIPKEEISSEDDINNVVKATKTYMNLSDEEKEQVTNIDDLKMAQEKAGRINHESKDVEISGVDWNIKLIVNPLSDDKEAMNNFEKKVDRRSLFSLYEIHLLDLLTGEYYEVPYGQKVSVILPAPDLTGCTSEVAVHEKTNGSIEYLDLNIVDNRAQFQTSSFSLFGIAAKKIQNYVENPSDMKISVNSLVDSEDELKSLLGDGLVSQLGKLIDEDNEKSAKDNNQGDNSGNIDENSSNTETDGSLDTEYANGNDSQFKNLLGGVDLGNAYDWMKDNELVAVIIILLIGSLLIWLLLVMSRKKKKEEDENKN